MHEFDDLLSLLPSVITFLPGPADLPANPSVRSVKRKLNRTRIIFFSMALIPRKILPLLPVAGLALV